MTLPPESVPAGRLPYFKLAAAVLIGAGFLSAFSFFALIKFSELASDEARRGFLYAVGERVESELNDPQSSPSGSRPKLPQFVHDRRGGPGGPNGPGSFGGTPRDNRGTPHDERGTPPPPRNLGNRKGIAPPPRPEFWLLTVGGEILDQSSAAPPPPEFLNGVHPKIAHEVITYGPFLRIRAAPRALLLDTDPPLILVARDEHGRLPEKILFAQAILIFALLVGSLGLAATITFFYLRRKSREAREVLGRLSRGDLKARFEIRRVDQIGSLMLDFNRMTSEIEDLVHRLHEAENARTRLLQELGHDLRTPLTSMRTAFETLREHAARLTESDRESLMGMIGADIRYFGELLDELMQVADFSMPGYRTTTENVDLGTILANEVRGREAARGISPAHALTYHLDLRNDATNSGFRMLGESLLLQRAFRNALVNAERFARQSISIRGQAAPEGISVTIEDDGAGFSADALDSFGRRRERRERSSEKPDGHYSLGLGSVIMRTIAELHQGTVLAENVPPPREGARVVFRFARR